MYVECKNYNKLVNKTKRSRLTDIENNLVATSGERGNIRVGGRKRVAMGLYEIMCVKLLKTVKHYRI